ncbi:MAG TPA: hypothetical protein VF794_04935 [Archangium sp.]|jgi:asparagine N-glycosylation enzyme membrane subunit Stt3|uniref:hypothetical protein n=1 Tax=Archangium sp. TaxID=1872627 RepID=UPI002EDA06F7
MRRGLGLALLAALGLHAATKGQARLPELLWICHVASTLLAVGLLASVQGLVALGFLIHVGMGMPAFLIDVAFGERPSPTSWLVHLLPLVAGGVALRHTGLPPRTWLAAWGAVLILLAVSILLTPPALNINLVHEAWGPTKDVLPGVWPVRVFHALEALGLLFGAELLLQRVYKRDT